MSEDTPGYSVHDRRGQRPPAEGCRVCGSPEVHTRAAAYPTIPCIVYLRAEIGTLQGEVLALRIQLAAKPTPLITTYAQLAIATGIPIERLLALGVFGPELPDAGSIGVSRRLCKSKHPAWGLCLRRKSHRPPHANHVSGGRWVDPPASPPEPQTEAAAAIADAATWPETRCVACQGAGVIHTHTTAEDHLCDVCHGTGRVKVTHLRPPQPRVVEPGEEAR